MQQDLPVNKPAARENLQNQVQNNQNKTKKRQETGILAKELADFIYQFIHWLPAVHLSKVQNMVPAV